jgi:hypothetical protein
VAGRPAVLGVAQVEALMRLGRALPEPAAESLVAGGG